MHEWSCHEIAQRVRAGDVSAEEVVAHHLDRIEARGDLNAFITTDRERALARRPLAGARRAGWARSPASRSRPRTSSTPPACARPTARRCSASTCRRARRRAVQRLVDAGAVIVGKANLHEFAWGVTSKNPFYGTVGNPRRPGHVPAARRRQRRRARGRARGAQHRHGHGRLDPHPVVRLRHVRLQAEPRARADRRLLPARALLRPRRADGAHDGGVRARARGARRPAAPRAAARGPARRRARRRSPTSARLEASGAHCEEAALPALGARAARSSPPSARTPTASSTPTRRDEYSPDLQRKMEPGLRADGRDLPRALGRGRAPGARAARASCSTTSSSRRRCRASCRSSRRRRRPSTARASPARCGRSTGSAGRRRRRATA